MLYRGLGMVPFRLLVRFKVFQLAAVAALAIPISTFLSEVRRQAAPIVSTTHMSAMPQARYCPLSCLA